MKNSIGVIIGRFQLDTLHEGHIKLISEVLNQHKKVIVFVGIRQSPPTKTNPLPFHAIYMTIRDLFPSVLIFPLLDCPTDREWSKQIDNLISSAYPSESAIIYGGRNGCITQYTGRHATCELNYGLDHISSTNYRLQIGQEIENSTAFRRGIIYAMQNLPHRKYLTVDIALFKRNEILLVKRHSEIGWRFPGGFVDPKETFMEAAKRELFEETGLEATHWKYLKDFPIDDWRIRGVDGVDHLTVLFSANYIFGVPVPRDDVDEAKFVNIQEISSRDIVPEHKLLFAEALTTKFNFREEATITNDSQSN